MKKSFLSIAILACTSMFVACTDTDADEGKVTGDENYYVAVNIVSADNGMTKAFTNGSTEEGAVKVADFYFYDDNGNFITSSTVTPVYVTAQPQGGNIERISDAMLVLDKVYSVPTQVLTVVNNKFLSLANVSLSTALTRLAENAADAYLSTIDGTDYFVMTSSTYIDGNAVKCATRIPQNCIQTTQALALANPMNIYVERVAAKVEVENSVPTLDGATDGTVFADAAVIVDGSIATLSVSLTGKWALGATNMSTYWFKQLDGSWNLGWTWNDTANHRSYWALDNNYTGGAYPTDYADFSEFTTATANTAGYKYCDALKYVSFNDLSESFGNSVYCQENTMTAAVASANNNSAVTHVIVGAKVQVAGNTNANDDLYAFRGAFYTTSAKYLTAVADYLNGTGLKKVVSGVSTDLAADDLNLTVLYDGYVQAEVKNGIVLSDGDFDFSATKANYYNDGAMYYWAPVKHLGGSGADGEYGVVRNHYYQLDLKSVSGLGKSVADLDEPIVPNNKIDTYYVAAKLNILAWNIVSQNVDLK